MSEQLPNYTGTKDNHLDCVKQLNRLPKGDRWLLLIRPEGTASMEVYANIFEKQKPTDLMTIEMMRNATTAAADYADKIHGPQG